MQTRPTRSLATTGSCDKNKLKAMVAEINSLGRNSFFEGTDLGPPGDWKTLRGRTAGCILHKFQVVTTWDLNSPRNDTSIPDSAAPFHEKLLDALASCCAPGDSQSWCIDAAEPAFCTLHKLVNQKDQENDAGLLVEAAQQLASGAYQLFSKFEEGYSEKAEKMMSVCKDTCSVEKIKGLKDRGPELIEQ